MNLLSKYHYEKIWQKTLDKDLPRILEEEVPDIPIEETIAYIKSECAKGKTVSFISLSFKSETKN